MTKKNISKVRKIHKWNSVAVSDLKEDCLITLENGLELKFIGQVDIHSNQDYLFKTMYSPFATTRWMQLTPEKIYELKVIKLKFPTKK